MKGSKMKKEMLKTSIFLLGSCFVLWRFLHHSIDKQTDLLLLTSINGEKTLSFHCRAIFIVVLLSYLFVRVSYGSYQIYKKTKKPKGMYFLEIASIGFIVAICVGMKIKLPPVFTAMMDNGVLILS